MTKAILFLEDGAHFSGEALSSTHAPAGAVQGVATPHTRGSTGESAGEVVFNTAMSGYQEILTDPSYAGQIVVMTYPLIGNYGVNNEDVESDKVHVKGFVVKEFCRVPSNYRSTQSLIDYLNKNKIMAIEGIDTRALTRHLRVRGAMKGIISCDDFDPESLMKKLAALPSMEGSDWVKEVTAKKKYVWNEGSTPTFRLRGSRSPDRVKASVGRINSDVPFARKSESRSRRSFLSVGIPIGAKRTSEPNESERREGQGARYKVAAIDCGIKFNILRILTGLGCEVHVFPANASAAEIKAIQPDGLFISNGPGDPAAVTYVVETVKQLIGALPIFGICLGHQILGLALGGRTYKMKFGHHGANHPVKDLLANRIGITSQNHGFCVDIDSLGRDAVEIIDTNLNDKTLEGIRHKKYPILSFQYHPEAAPGPHDAQYLFKYFIEMMEQRKS